MNFLIRMLTCHWCNYWYSWTLAYFISFLFVLSFCPYQLSRFFFFKVTSPSFTPIHSLFACVYFLSPQVGFYSFLFFLFYSEFIIVSSGGMGYRGLHCDTGTRTPFMKVSRLLSLMHRLLWKHMQEIGDCGYLEGEIVGAKRKIFSIQTLLHFDH